MKELNTVEVQEVNGGVILIALAFCAGVAYGYAMR
ncbi:class IIb bacteriocin, lactobin A/cerein 7B family [Colwellia sp. TT2012]|nr:class IIb bacteriocin, lactobin A/cerein 7B family [Colwellia sp. TT2012]